MSKRLILILALAFAVGISFAAYAEVQNVKVSGDITIKGVSRNNLDLAKTGYPTDSTLTLAQRSVEVNQDEEDNFMSIIRLRIDADLTDNVSTTLRLINERDWDSDANQVGTEENDIDLDLAYVTMKEFLFSPLSMTIGRQELRYGNGLIVGDPDTNNLAGSSLLDANDLSLRKAFDAIKAVLNYDPLVVDLVYAKIDEGTALGANANDDTNLYGVNLNYALNKENMLEAYLFSKRRGSADAQFTTAASRTRGVALANLITKHDTVHTLGARVVNTSLKNLALQLEGAIQRGTYNPGFDINSQENALTGERDAWALQLIATYDLKDVKPISKYSPSITGSYTYLSGEKNTRGQDANTSKKYHGWDPMYEDQTSGHLANRIFAATNCQVAAMNTKLKPIEDVTLSLDYVELFLNKKYPSQDIPDAGETKAGYQTTNLRGVTASDTYRMTSNRHLGRELDTTLTYDYTEDVQFSLLGGVFFPGDAFHETNDSRATELIGSMKVTF